VQKEKPSAPDYSKESLVSECCALLHLRDHDLLEVLTAVVGRAESATKLKVLRLLGLGTQQDINEGFCRSTMA